MKEKSLPFRATVVATAVFLLLILAACNKENNLPNDTSLSSSGVVLDSFFSYSGKYVEDGSDSPVENIAAVTVTNDSEKAWQLIKFDVMAGGEHYSFKATALLPGMTLTVLESDKKSFPKGESETFFAVTESGEFSVKPEKHNDLFKTDIYNGIANLTNLADRDFENDVYIYYKNKSENGYSGGITYRVNMGAVKKGGISQRASKHLVQGESEILFITYGQ